MKYLYMRNDRMNSMSRPTKFFRPFLKDKDKAYWIQDTEHWRSWLTRACLSAPLALWRRREKKCLPVYLSTSLSVCPTSSLFIYLTGSIKISLSVFPSARLSHELTGSLTIPLFGRIMGTCLSNFPDFM